MEVGPGTVVVITGAASGIGLAMAEAFAREGCSIVLADVETDALAAAERRISDLGVGALSVATDVRQADALASLAAATIEHFGQVHVVCNNAGVVGGGDPWFGGIEGWEWVIGVNFWGVVHGIRAFLPHLIASGAGHIVNTASIAGLLPGFTPAYDASKHAVVAISESLLYSMRAAGLPIGVSCVCPGWVRTGIIDAERNWPSDLGQPPAHDAAAEIVRKHVRRAIDEGMQPAAVADLVLSAVRHDRYWVFPHPDFLELAIERFQRVSEQLDPAISERGAPGLPSSEVIMAEIEAAMAELAATAAPADPTDTTPTEAS